MKSLKFNNDSKLTNNIYSIIDQIPKINDCGEISEKLLLSSKISEVSIKEISARMSSFAENKYMNKVKILSQTLEKINAAILFLNQIEVKLEQEKISIDVFIEKVIRKFKNYNEIVILAENKLRLLINNQILKFSEIKTNVENLDSIISEFNTILVDQSKLETILQFDNNINLYNEYNQEDSGDKDLLVVKLSSTFKKPNFIINAINKDNKDNNQLNKNNIIDLNNNVYILDDEDIDDKTITLDGNFADKIVKMDNNLNNYYVGNVNGNGNSSNINCNTYSNINSNINSNSNSNTIFQQWVPGNVIISNI